MKRLLDHAASSNMFWPVIRSTLIPAAEYVQWQRQRIESTRKTTSASTAQLAARLSPGLIVRNGPFSGMKYAAASTGSTLLPKLLGSYEMELWPVWKRIQETPYTEIIVIGCAEGYYAVGLALRFRKAQVFAYDTDSKARDMCQVMASLNGVCERVAIYDICTSQRLANFAFTGRGLIVCDCEGFEGELFSPPAVENIKTCDCLIELHDCYDISISSRILSSFSATHDAQLIESVDDIKKAKTYSFAELDPYSLAERKEIVAESRPGIMEWAFLTPKCCVSLGGKRHSQPSILC
jgi:hypothetical protein